MFPAGPSWGCRSRHEAATHTRGGAHTARSSARPGPAAKDRHHQGATGPAPWTSSSSRINDFHGNLAPPGTLSCRAACATPAGGVEYLATHVKRCAARTATRWSSAPATSSARARCLGAVPRRADDRGDERAGPRRHSVGNHEFDEGSDELLRMQDGGCRPVDGCQDGDGFAGADFDYLAANVVDDDTGRTLFPPYVIRRFGGVKVGFIGVTLEDTPRSSPRRASRACSSATRPTRSTVSAKLKRRACARSSCSSTRAARRPRAGQRLHRPGGPAGRHRRAHEQRGRRLHHRPHAPGLQLRHRRQGRHQRGVVRRC